MFRIFTCCIFISLINLLSAEDVTPDYLAPTFACQWDTTQSPDDDDLTDELVALVKKLDKEPVKIYNWVRNNIDNDIYIGCRKGALTTYITRRGNSWDQCALLVSLMRIAGVDARYNHLGVNQTDSIVGFKEFIFAEIYIEQNSYRGNNTSLSNIENAGQWIKLAPWDKANSIKGIDFSDEILNVKYHMMNYLYEPDETGSLIKSKSPLDYFEDKLIKYIKENRDSLQGYGRKQLTFKDIQLNRNIKAEHYPFLPLSLPKSYKDLLDSAVQAKGEFREIPPECRASTKLYIFSSDQYGVDFSSRTKLLEKQIFLAEVASRKLILDWAVSGDKLSPRFRINDVDYETTTKTVLDNSSFFISYQAMPNHIFDLPSELTEPMDRPPQSVKTITAIDLDYLSSSENKLEKLKEKLSILSSEDAVSTDLDKKNLYLGCLANFFSSSFSLRAYNINHRATKLFFSKPYFETSSPTFIYLPLDIENQKKDDESKFLYHYPCQIDAFGFFSSPIKVGENGELISQLTDDSRLFQNLVGDSISLEESRIFEDGQDTPSLSTLKAFMVSVAAERPMPILQLAKGENDSLWLTYFKPLDKWTENDVLFFTHPKAMKGTDGWSWIRVDTIEELVTYVRNIANINGWLSHELPSFAYNQLWSDMLVMERIIFTGVIVPVNGIGAFAYHCRNADESIIGYVFNGAILKNNVDDSPLNGGMGGDIVSNDDSYESWDDFYDDFSNNVSTGSQNDIEDTYSDFLNLSEGDFSKYLDYDNDNVESALIADGDPVDMIKGEFYQEEQPDIYVKGRGFDLSIQRKYKSKLIYNGIFGYGWTWNHAERIIPLEDGLTYYNKDSDPYKLVLKSDGSGGYDYPAGTTFTVTKTPNGYEVHHRNSTVFSFNEDGYLQKKEDSHGNKLDFVYTVASSGKSLLSYIKDNIGRKLELQYNSNNKVESISFIDKDSISNHISCSYTYDNYGIADYAYDLVSFKNPENATTLYTYLYGKENENSALNHNMSRYTLPNGDYLDLFYYKNDTVSHHTNKQGDTFNFSYSRLNGYSETWNEEGYYRKIFYNRTEDVIRIDNKDGTIESKEYDLHHNVTSICDANGNKTQFSYDSKRNMIKRVDALDNIWHTFYDNRFNKVTVSINPENHINIQQWNVNGALVKSLRFPDATATWSYSNELEGLLDYVEVRDLSGNTWRFEFNEKNVVINDVKNGDISFYKMTYEYDEFGNLLSTADTDGNTNTLGYDSNFLYITSAEDKKGHITKFKNNRTGYPEIIIDPAGFATNKYYDKLNRQIKEMSPNNAVSELVYNDNGQLEKTILPDGSEVVNVYGVARDIVSKANVIEKIDPLGKSEYYEYNRLGKVTAKIDKNGNKTRYYYDEMDRIIRQVDPLGNDTTFDYDGNGNIIANTDTRGFITSYEYDGLNRKVSESHAVKNVSELDATPLYTEKRIEYTYYPDGQIEYQRTFTIEPNSAPVEVFCTYFVYDSLNRLIEKHENHGKPNVRISKIKYISERSIQYTNPEGVISSKEMDIVGNVIKETVFKEEYDPSVALSEEELEAMIVDQTIYEYDARNLVVKKTLFNGAILAFEYDAMRRLVKEIDALGNETSYVYDIRGNRTATVNAFQELTTIHYDKMGRKVRVVDAKGNISSLEYDNNGNAIRITDALGNVSKAYYDALNRKIADEDALGNMTTYDYDANGNLLFTTNALSQTTTYTYSPFNQPLSITDHLGNTSYNEYDLQGRLWKTIDQRGVVTENTYNDFSEIESAIKECDHLGDDVSQTTIVTNTYDNMGRVIMTEDATGIKNIMEYDELGRAIRITHNAVAINTDGTATLQSDPTNPSIVSETNYGFRFDSSQNKLGLKVTSTAAKGSADEATTVNRYDFNGNLVSITNAESATVNYEYDTLNRKTKYVDADNTFELFTYDVNGNLETHTKRDLTVMTYTYDELNRNSQIKEGIVTRQEFVYDNLSRITLATDHNQDGTIHTVGYEYDKLSRVTCEIQDGVRIETQYEAESHAEPSVATSLPQGSTWTLQRYPNASPVIFENGKNGLLNKTYSGEESSNSLTSISEFVSNSYYKSNKLMQQTVNIGTDNITHGRWYDAKNRETVRDYATPQTMYQQNIIEYDSRSNIMYEIITAPTITNETFIRKKYSYDLLDRVKMVTDANDNEKESWQYDKVGNWTFTNQKGLDETRTPNADNEYSDTGYSYDSIGNLTNHENKIYNYDWANRLVSVSDESGLVATYTYDAMNRRVSKSVVDGNITTTYTYSGSQVLEEAENGTFKRSYIYGNYVDEPLAMYDAVNNKTYTYIRDRQYSIVGLVDENGAVIESYKYSAYGLRTVFDANGDEIACTNYNNYYGYTGRRFDEESGLWYYRNRMYSAELGRFLQRDPAGYVDGMNLYAYVMNNPMSYLDPTGRTANPVWRDGNIDNLVDGPVWQSMIDCHPDPRPYIEREDPYDKYPKEIKEYLSIIDSAIEDEVSIEYKNYNDFYGIEKGRSYLNSTTKNPFQSEGTDIEKYTFESSDSDKFVSKVFNVAAGISSIGKEASIPNKYEMTDKNYNRFTKPSGVDYANATLDFLDGYNHSTQFTPDRYDLSVHVRVKSTITLGVLKSMDSIEITARYIPQDYKFDNKKNKTVPLLIRSKVKDAKGVKNAIQEKINTYK